MEPSVSLSEFHSPIRCRLRIKIGAVEACGKKVVELALVDQEGEELFLIAPLIVEEDQVIFVDGITVDSIIS
jgi:hypothetical protein